MGTLTYLIPLAVYLGVPVPAEAQGSPAGVKQFTLVYTVNGFGETEPVGCPHKVLHDGGIPRRMACIREIEAAEGPLLLLDGGASLFPDIDKAPDNDRLNLLLKAEFICEAYNRLGYHALAVGTSELLLGLDELHHVSESAKFPFLSANLRSGNEAPFKPYTVVEVGGVRIGVIGLLIDTIGQVYLKNSVPQGKVESSIEAARKAVRELEGKTDFIVALSHINQNTNRRLAKEVKGIDIVIDPSIEYNNHHPRVKDPEWEELVGSTLILRADGKGASIGVANIEFREARAGMGSRLRLYELETKEKEGTATEADRAEIQQLRGKNLFTLRRLPLSPHYLDDLEGAALLNAYKNGEEVEEVSHYAKPGGRDRYLKAAACKDCHEAQYENWTRTKHFKAFDGIIASGGQRRPECITCHSTGYGQAFLDPAETKEYSGVQCEACHGTQPNHVKDPKNYPFSSISESTCLPCHNRDILKKAFSYYSSVSQVKCPKGD